MIQELVKELNHVIDLISEDKRLFEEIKNDRLVNSIVFLNLGIRIGMNEMYVKNLQDQLDILHTANKLRKKL